MVTAAAPPGESAAGGVPPSFWTRSCSTGEERARIFSGSQQPHRVPARVPGLGGREDARGGAGWQAGGGRDSVPPWRPLGRGPCRPPDGLQEEGSNFAEKGPPHSTKANLLLAAAF